MFVIYKKQRRVRALDDKHISITSSGISFGKTKPPYTRVVIEYDLESSRIRFHEPEDAEYGFSYKIGKNPATGSYGLRAAPFVGTLPTGYYKKVSNNTYQLNVVAKGVIDG